MKKRILIFLSFCSTMCLSQGLNINSLLRSSSQQLIEDAVQNGIYLIQSSYQLEDSTGQRFGLDGQPFFNRLEYFGCILNGGIIIPDEAFRPWQEDQEIKQYIDSYKPVLYEVNIRTLKDSIFHSMDSLAFKDTVCLWNGYVAARKKNIQGFEIDTTAGNKDGWLILIDYDDYAITSIHKSVQIISEGKQIIEVPTALPKILGGVYVVPTVKSIGQVTFQLGGIVLPADGGKKLTILYPFLGKNYAKQLNPISKGGTIQPIKVDDKFKKRKEIKDIKSKH